MATIKFRTFSEANFFAKKVNCEQGIGVRVKRFNEGFLVEGNFQISQNDVFIPPKQVPTKKANRPPSIKTYKSSEYSHLTEEQKAAILEARKNEERDINPHLINNLHYPSQEEAKRNIHSNDLRLCIDCGKSIPEGRNDPRCLPCKTLYEKSHDTRPKINEGIAGTREENKKMRGGLYGDMLRRSKQ